MVSIYISPLGGGSTALSHPGDDLLNLDGSPMQFGSTTVNKSKGSIYYIIEKRQAASGG
ncbi:MAG TPA: hypothetical protein VNL13_01740 [Sulfolobales archaeon]|nr:hypothetical protein [Sulfolobales archaeon]